MVPHKKREEYYLEKEIENEVKEILERDENISEDEL